MKTLNIKVYSINELSSEAQEKAISNYRNKNQEFFWQDETIESLKGLFEACEGVTLKDYSLGEYNSRLDVSFSNDESEELTGKRAFAWLENNLLKDLRVKGGINHIKERVRVYDNKINPNHAKGAFITLAGAIKECPFTGYCTDNDFLDCLTDSIKSGMTLKESFESLAGEYEKIINNEIEYQNGEEYIKEHMEANDFQFLEDGTVF